MHNVNTGSDVYAPGSRAVAVNGIQQGATTNIQRFPFPFLLHVKARILTSLIDEEENGTGCLRIQTGGRERAREGEGWAWGRGGSAYATRGRCTMYLGTAGRSCTGFCLGRKGLRRALWRSVAGFGREWGWGRWARGACVSQVKWVSVV